MIARTTLLAAVLAAPLLASDEEPIDAKLVAAWAKQLSSKTLEEQQRAAFQLDKAGPAAAPAADALIAALAVPDDAVRFYSMRALGKIGPKAKAAVPGLVKLLEHDNPALVRQAAASLGRMGKDSIAPVVKLLTNPSPRTRRVAATALGLIGTDAASAAPALAAALADDSFRVRRTAAEALTLIKPTTTDVRDALVAALNREVDPDVCRSAAVALGKMGEPALPGLLALLNSTNADHRFHAAVGLRELGPKAAPGVGGLAKMLSDKDEELRSAGSSALGRIGEPALPGLLEGLTNASPEVRQGAAVGLGSMGKSAAKAVKPLIAALNDGPTAVAAANALGQIGDPEAVGPLTKLLAAESAEAAGAAAKALSEMGPASAPAVDALVTLMRRKEAPAREAAAVALIRIGKKATGPTAKVLGEKDARLRMLALVVLGSVGAVEAVPAMAERLKDPEREVRVYAARSLGRLGPDAKAGLKALEAALASEKDDEVVDALKEAVGQVSGK